jgi:hypothetical protein
MRFIKSLPIVIVLTAMILIYAMTRSYDPLETYRYTLTRDELEERLIQVIKSKSNLTFNLTDSTGTDETDLNYYADLIIKTGTEEYEYNFKYNKETSFWDKDVKSEICLIGAFDKIRKTGGYKTDDTDVEKLIIVFESELIKDLDEMNTSYEPLFY